MTSKIYYVIINPSDHTFTTPYSGYRAIGRSTMYNIKLSVLYPMVKNRFVQFLMYMQNSSISHYFVTPPPSMHHPIPLIQTDRPDSQNKSIKCRHVCTKVHKNQTFFTRVIMITDIHRTKVSVCLFSRQRFLKKAHDIMKRFPHTIICIHQV